MALLSATCNSTLLMDSLLSCHSPSRPMACPFNRHVLHPPFLPLSPCRNPRLRRHLPATEFHQSGFLLAGQMRRQLTSEERLPKPTRRLLEPSESREVHLRPP